jgi:hypothetical protein
MKIHGIFLIGIISIKILCFLSCGNRQGNKKIEINNIEKDIVTKIEVKKVDFYITSIIHIDCNVYEKYFNTMKSRHIITAKDSISLLMNIISNLQKDTSNYRPDTRAKLLIYHKNNSIDTLCMSLVGILLNGESYLVDKRLIEIVDEL